MTNGNGISAKFATRDTLVIIGSMGAVITVVTGVMAGLWGLAISPIRSDIERLSKAQESAVSDLKSDAKGYRDDLARQLNDRIAEINRHFDALDRRFDGAERRLEQIERPRGR